ncbi:MAG: methyltransferase domain-containing protein [Chloroflexi bacterium]|nr:methyltransferase domain-containing protein [Chloroflexota bacterium]
MVTVLETLAEEYPAWWVDLLGEHNHVGGVESTRWLLERARLQNGDLMLDAGAFIGAAARLAAGDGVRAVAADVAADFLKAGRQLERGHDVTWVAASTSRLPFKDGAFASVWCLESYLAPRELSRVSARKATLCLCCEVPEDSRGGVESFIDEWAEYGWELAAHKTLTLEATQLWRRCEAELVRRRPFFEPRYGKRGYLRQLDHVAGLLQQYERGGVGHGLFVFARQG